MDRQKDLTAPAKAEPSWFDEPKAPVPDPPAQGQRQSLAGQDGHPDPHARWMLARAAGAFRGSYEDWLAFLGDPQRRRRAPRRNHTHALPVGRPDAGNPLTPEADRVGQRPDPDATPAASSRSSDDPELAAVLADVDRRVRPWAPLLRQAVEHGLTPDQAGLHLPVLGPAEPGPHAKGEIDGRPGLSDQQPLRTMAALEARAKEKARNVRRALELKAEGHSKPRITQIMTAERRKTSGETAPPVSERSVARWLQSEKPA